MTIKVQDQSTDCFPYAWWGLLEVGACVSGYVIGIGNCESWIERIVNWKLKMRVPCKLQVPRRYANTMICTFPYVSGLLVLDRRRGKEGAQRKLNCSKGEFRISDFWLLMPSNLHYFGIYWQNVLYVLFQYARHYMKYLWVQRNVKFNGKSKGFLGLSHALIMHNDPKIDDP